MYLIPKTGRLLHSCILLAQIVTPLIQSWLPLTANLLTHSQEEICDEDYCLWPYCSSWHLLSFVAFTFVDFIFLSHCQSGFAHGTVSHLLETDFQFLPDQSITSAFDSDKPSLKQRLFIAFPLLTLRLCEYSLTVLL